MYFKQFLTSASLIASVAAQLQSFTQSDYSLSVHVPADTASSKSGPIYFQITAPSGTQWAAFGQGTQMSGANMFIIYADSSNNVVLSPRRGTGQVMPQYDSSIQATLLNGTGIAADGTLTANVRCDSCLSWSGGSMDPTSSSSDWIFAYRTGNAIGSSDKTASIVRHNTHSNFNLNLVSATGNENVILGAATSDGTPTSSSGSPSATGTNSVSSPLASSNPSTNTSPVAGDQSTSSSLKSSPYTHGVLMSVLFVGLFPLFALTIYLPISNKVRYIHAPLQAINVILLIVGLALGVVYGKEIQLLDGYHQIIGYVVFVLLIAFQPALGIYQHLHFHKTGQRSVIGVAHQWLGRAAIALGIINGGLGWNLTESTGAYIPYGVVAGIVFVIYVGVVLFSSFTKRRSSSSQFSQDKEGIRLTSSNKAHQ